MGYIVGVAEKLVTVVEVDPFPAAAARAGLDEDNRVALAVRLAHDPLEGDLIVGAGGLRKLRWRGKHRGKRGGFRVIYYYAGEGFPVYLLAIYGKAQQVDLTPQQRARLAALAAELKAAAKASVRARRRR